MFARWPRRSLPLAAVLLVGGCGGSSSTSTSSSSTAPEAGAALAADAKSAATGDIPDNQAFLTLDAPRARISIVYPEGWSVQESAASVSIKEKNNVVRIALARGAAPTIAGVQAQLEALVRSTPGLTAGRAQAVSLKAGPAVRAAYTTQSAPNPVTGKQVTLTVDRYVLAHAGRVAIVDEGTPVGVDNVDAYKRMIESFRWR
jgi:hypothetical protein